jgi:DNA-binding response OmpR family regulator
VRVNGLGVALVVEDDDDVRGLLEDVLRHAGFEVRSAATGQAGAELARSEHPTVVTLDVGLPDIDGFEVLRRIRAGSDAYVVMLTASDEESDALFALQSGADDYLTKPFRPRELRARIGAMLRRPRAASGSQRPPAAGPHASSGNGPGGNGAASHGVGGHTPGANGVPHHGSGTNASAGNGTGHRGMWGHEPLPGDHVLRNGALALDPRTRMAAVAGAELELTRSEFDLLHSLLRAGGRVLTRAELVRVARGDRFRDDSYVSEADERAVEVHLGNLRRKLGDDPRAPRWLMTVRGVGYRLRPAGD